MRKLSARSKLIRLAYKNPSLRGQILAHLERTSSELLTSREAGAMLAEAVWDVSEIKGRVMAAIKRTRPMGEGRRGLEEVLAALQELESTVNQTRDRFHDGNFPGFF